MNKAETNLVIENKKRTVFKNNCEKILLFGVTYV